VGQSLISSQWVDVALGISQNGSWLWWLNEEVIQIFVL